MNCFSPIVGRWSSKLEKLWGFVLACPIPTNCQGGDAKDHLAGMEEAEDQEDEDGREEVVGLVVKQVVHNPVEPPLEVVELWQVEPG